MTIFTADNGTLLRLGEAHCEKQYWRHDDQTAEDTVGDLRRSDGDGTDVDDVRRRLLAGRLEQHAVGDHRQKERRHAGAEALGAGEERLLRPVADGEPHVILEDALRDVLPDEYRRIEVDEGVRYSESPFDLSILLVHGQPTVANECVPRRAV